MRRYSLSLFFLLFIGWVGANESSIQQLVNRLNNTTSDKERGEMCALIAKEYFNTNADSVFYYALKTIQYGENAKENSIIGRGHHAKGVALQKKLNWSEAIHSFYTALKIREELNEAALIASTKMSIGNNFLAFGEQHENEGEYEKADENYGKAKKYYEQSLITFLSENDSAQTAFAYQNLGSCHFRLYDYPAAIENFTLSYQWTPHIKKSSYFGENQANILIAKYEQQAETGNMTGKKELMEQFIELSTYFKEHAQNKQWVNLTINIAAVLWSDNATRSIDLLKSADSIAETSNLTHFRITANQYLYELHKELGNMDSALFYFERLTDLQRNISNSETRTKIEELNIQYNTEKKEKMLIQQQATVNQTKAEKNTLIVLLIGGGILLIGLTLFFLQRQYIVRLRRKRDQEAHNQEVSTLLTNQELKSIESMLEGQETERKRIAEDLHDRLGSTLSATKMYFEATLPTEGEDTHPTKLKAYELLDKAIKDTREISHNLVSGSLSRFGLFVALKDLKETIEGASTIKVNIILPEKDGRFHSEVEIQVYRIVQEAFSNSLKHATPTLLSIEIIQSNTRIDVRISDNGIGFETESIHSGMGLQTIRGRVSKLGGEYSLISSKGAGTTYEIHFTITDVEEENYHSR